MKLGYNRFRQQSYIFYMLNLVFFRVKHIPNEIKESVTIRNVVLVDNFNQFHFSYEVPFNFICPYIYYSFKSQKLQTFLLLQFFSNFEKISSFLLSLKVRYTSLHDVAMVIRKENISSNDNAKMFGQGCLFYSLY